MSATHYGCGCLVNRDGEGQIASLGLCDRHRSVLQPELDVLYDHMLRLRREDAEAQRTRAESEVDASTSAPDGPDIEVVWVPERPIDLVRRKP